MRRDLGQLQSGDDESGDDESHAAGKKKKRRGKKREGRSLESGDDESGDEDGGPLDTQRLNADTQRILRGEQAFSRGNLHAMYQHVGFDAECHLWFV